MIEEMVGRLAAHNDVIRVTVSDREGLLISSATGPAESSVPEDAGLTDDLWNAYMAQFATNLKVHLRNLTLTRPLELVVHGSHDDIVIVWLHVGWLIARVRKSANWPTLWEVVRGIRDEFDALTGEPANTGGES